MVGEGSKVHLWKDRWLDKPITNNIHLNSNVVLNTKVSDILTNEGWRFPRSFVDNFLALVGPIRKVVLPLQGELDHLV